MKVVLAQINPTVGALKSNRQKIIDSMTRAKKLGADLILFPELALCGYPPNDLLLMPSFIEALEAELETILEASSGLIAIVGTVRKNPTSSEKGLYNTAAIIDSGELVGFQDKTLLPDYDVFIERRYFEPAGPTHVWSLKGKRIAITICEDIWKLEGSVEGCNYPIDPVADLASERPELLLNLSASPFCLGRVSKRIEVCQTVAHEVSCPVLFCNQVGGNDSLIFDGSSLYVDGEGELIQVAKQFEEDFLFIDLEKKSPPTSLPAEGIEGVYEALLLGIRDYFFKLGFEKACLGISGGIDSAVVAALAVDALGSENVLGLALPSRFSSEEGKRDARELAQNLDIELREISIEKTYTTLIQELEPHFVGWAPDVTEENLQARIRGVILMAFSNKMGHLLLGTGNKSEMALGYTTLYGDLCGGLGVLSDVSKKRVYELAGWINRDAPLIPESIFSKPPSAELREGQKDRDSLPDYDVIDRVLCGYVEEHKSIEQIAREHHLTYDLVKSLVRKIHQSEYKRQQAPPGLRVTKKAFSVGRHFPIVQQWNLK